LINLAQFGSALLAHPALHKNGFTPSFQHPSAWFVPVILVADGCIREFIPERACTRRQKKKHSDSHKKRSGTEGCPLYVLQNSFIRSLAFPMKTGMMGKVMGSIFGGRGLLPRGSFNRRTTVVGKDRENVDHLFIAPHR